MLGGHLHQLGHGRPGDVGHEHQLALLALAAAARRLFGSDFFCVLLGLELAAGHIGRGRRRRRSAPIAIIDAALRLLNISRLAPGRTARREVSTDLLTHDPAELRTAQLQGVLGMLPEFFRGRQPPRRLPVTTFGLGEPVRPTLDLRHGLLCNNVTHPPVLLGMSATRLRVWLEGRFARLLLESKARLGFCPLTPAQRSLRIERGLWSIGTEA